MAKLLFFLVIFLMLIGVGYFMFFTNGFDRLLLRLRHGQQDDMIKGMGRKVRDTADKRSKELEAAKVEAETKQREIKSAMFDHQGNADVVMEVFGDVERRRQEIDSSKNETSARQ